MGDEQEFAESKFRMDCQPMVLTGGRVPPLRFEGPGEVWQDADGALQFKMFVSEHPLELFRIVVDGLSVGSLIPPERYFTLQLSSDGRPDWKAERVQFGVRGCGNGSVLTGHLQELRRQESLPKSLSSDGIVLRFRGKHEFPCNTGTVTTTHIGEEESGRTSTLNVAAFSLGSQTFRILHEGEHTAVHFSGPSGTTSEGTAARIEESLQFVLGKSMWPSVVETMRGDQKTTRLISTSKREGLGELLPPLMRTRLTDGDEMWTLFRAYFQHVRHDASPRWHPISKQVGRAIEGSAGSIEAGILNLAIGIEGLLQDCFQDLAPVAAPVLKDLDAALVMLRTDKISEVTQKRIAGAIGAMRSPRNADRLHEFIRIHGLDPGLYDTWKIVRNDTAHGRGSGGRDLGELFKLRNEVLFLFYCIILAAIGYQGVHTDYTKAEWTDAKWPPTTTPLPSVPAPLPA